MAFSLKKQSAKVAHVNLREEKHGDEPVLACDVEVTADVPNTFLSQLSPTLKASLYQAEGAQVGAQTPLIDDGTHLPVLLYPQLGRIAWELKMPAAHVVLHGARKSEDVVLVADVNKLRLSPKEGGTVEIQFRCQFPPVPEQVGAVGAMLGRTVKVSVKPNDAPDSPPDSEE